MRTILHRSHAGRGAVAIVLVGLLLILSQIVAWQDTQPHWFGIEVTTQNDRAVLSHVTPGGWAWDYGARPGDTLVAVNGATVSPEEAAAFTWADTVDLVSPGGETLHMDFTAIPHNTDETRLVYHVITAAFIAVSAIVFILAADVLAASALLALATAVGTMFIAVQAQHTGAEWAFTIVFGAVVTLGWSVLHFFLLFPINRLTTRWGKLLSRLSTGAFVLELGLLLAALTVESAVFSIFKLLVYVLLIVQLGIAMSLVVMALLRTSPERRAARRALAVVAVGSVVALSPLLLLSLLPYLLFSVFLVPSSISVLTLGLMPASLGFAVLSREFLGIQRLLRRGLILLGVWTGLLAAYTFLWRLPMLQPSPNIDGDLLTGIKLAATLGTFPLLQARLGRVIERVLFRDVYNYNATLREFGSALVRISGLDDIADYSLATLGKTLDLTWATIVLRGTETEPVLRFCSGTCPSTTHAALDEAALDLRGRQAGLLDNAYVTPLVVEGAHVGVLVVGPKAHDEELMPEDEALLHSLAPTIATALGHALLVRRLEAQVQVLAQRERDLAGLNARLVEVQEDERRTLALDLHDDPLQRAAMLHRRLGSVARLHPEIPDLDVCRESAELIEVALRAICVGLRPRMLDDLGLEAAAQWLVRDLRARSDLEIELDVSTVDGEPFGRLDPALEIGLFRVAQEGLNNAIKHAEANRVVVALVRDTDAIRLRVIDDGKGLAGAVGASTSLGLLGMRQRLAAWDASVSIANGAYGGVVVSADVPLGTAEALARAA